MPYPIWFRLNHESPDFYATLKCIDWKRMEFQKLNNYAEKWCLVQLQFQLHRTNVSTNLKYSDAADEYFT